VATATSTIKTIDNSEFANDLNCEGVYEVDFSLGNFVTTFNGLTKEYSLDELPTDENYLSAMGEEIPSMTNNKSETFFSRCEILAELWVEYRDDDQFKDFIAHQDIGLPLAYVISNEIVKPTKIAKDYVNETFELFAVALGLEVDDDWTTLSQMIEYAKGTGTFPE
jgi:hypothetical protein